MNNCHKIFVIGAGAFGTALSNIIASRGHANVTLLGRNVNMIKQLEDTRINAKSLPDIKLSSLLHFSSDHTLLQEADIVLFATSSKGYGEALNFYKKWLKDCAQIVICSKGFEYHSGMLLSTYSEKVLPSHSISVLSGPGFACDIAQELPVGVILSSENIEISRRLSKILSHNSFQVYCSDDRIGVQIGGALKNVIAIASGIAKGRGFGESARAMIIVQGLSEMIKLAEAMGGRADTILGLSGIGDLILTATSEQSRNFSFGVSLGKGEQQNFDQMRLVEGGIAASRVIHISKKMDLHLPIFQAISDIMMNRLTIDKALGIFFDHSCRNKN
ncbi:NAD(P)-dependent glycerol-3-phosphate dehydrogenase [Candidatus Liberibacter africanus]|uniref:Glycerol-3-phosphate dehydrogenase [NAD(P)+] n=1 Tax=Candidatus Liberibacter africanus PTSAPSY TaxID=1277257 RepID=A0A0G3I7Q7_LIBAF|nr:NAD(P)H-dependent glycerol-3-phosphate dehydrogenase [Candidatus Liberibacter africanus]AKK20558.1 putative glycerol-3-phosphate dehydrogenase [Candidatus Liberibacter africanus PTSAPSY]QTP64258.1 NAD(P)-dependent glycerol-3-phosphate dehydrogenase [Candidatus Liberibacter africanus]